jgi:hypothetical protein
MWALSIAQCRISTDHLYRLSVLPSGPEFLFFICFEYRRLLCTMVHMSTLPARAVHKPHPCYSAEGLNPNGGRVRNCSRVKLNSTNGNSEIRQFLRPPISICYHSNTVDDRTSDIEVTLDWYTVYNVLCFIAQSVPVLCRQRATSALHLDQPLAVGRGCARELYLLSGNVFISGLSTTRSSQPMSQVLRRESCDNANTHPNHVLPSLKAIV